MCANVYTHLLQKEAEHDKSVAEEHLVLLQPRAEQQVRQKREERCVERRVHRVIDAADEQRR